MAELTARRSGPLRGAMNVPGDKSISHRSVLLGSLADGCSEVRGFLPSADCLATVRCMRALGVRIDFADRMTVTIHGGGLCGLARPNAALDCARSGTTMRLLAGILAGQRFDSTLSGDAQLLRRPMRRVSEPLCRMGAEIDTADGHGPLTIRGRALHGFVHSLPVASAQVKSALLLAGLYADGPTTVRQPGPARDHTERMLSAMGAVLRIDSLDVTLRPAGRLSPLTLQVPGDISSAAFPIVAALLVPGSELVFRALGINPTRVGLLDVLQRMGADAHIDNVSLHGAEPVADITVRSSELHGVSIGGSTVVRMIDEFPALAVAASQAHGTTVVQDAAELRVKETDRIATVVSELQVLGARIEPLPDGFVVEGPTRLHGGQVDSHGDHRLAMALALAGLMADGDVTIRRAECISDSFPGFIGLMRAVGACYD